MTRLLKTRHPHELLQAATVLAGGVPERSALILPVYGGRIGSAMRIDLPDDDCDDWADAVVHLARFVEADGAVVILYPSEPLGPGPLPWEAAADAVSAAADSAGLPLQGLFIVGTDCWGDFRHPEGPRGPLAELADADARFDGEPQPGPLVTGRAAVPDELGADAADRQRFRIDELIDLQHEIDPVALAHAVMDCDAPLDAATAAVLATLVQVPVIRDEVLMTLVAGPDEGYLTRAGAIEWHSTGVSPRVEDDASLLMGVTGDPDLKRVRAARELWRRVAEHTVTEQRPAVLAVLGWLHWALGEASSGDACAAAALEIDADHSFASIVASIIDSGSIPCWVQRSMRRTDVDVS